MAVKDEFVMTIDDEDDIIVHEEEEESTEIAEPTPKKKKGKKQNVEKATKEKNNENLFDSGFTFAMDGGGSTGIAHAWDFTAARNMLKTTQHNTIPRTSIDDIISKKRKEAMAMKKKETKQSLEDDEEENDLLEDNDEDVAMDGFGAGFEENEEEQEESDTEGEEEHSDQDDISQSEDESEKEDLEEAERKKAYFAPEEETEVQEHQSFSSMNLSRPILKGLASVGFIKPTDIQSRTIPIALLGKDICGGAVTGSGKTAAFVVPILERLLYRPRQVASTRVLILCPTRELAAQVHSVAVKLGSYTDISFCLCVGGLSLKTQEAELKLKPDVVVATPGRLIDHIRNSSGFGLDNCEILVMDEADRMLEDGFADELGEIVKSCPKSRQTMLFSATMTDNVDQLIRMSLNHPVRLFVNPSNQAASRLVQEFVRIRAHREADRSAVLMALCRKTFRTKVIVFFRAKVAAHQMKILFGLMGLKAAELHGNLTQEQRLEALEQFRDNKVDYLLATDLAARGLDIKGIETVINYNMPTQFPQYLHRIGRTARAGRNGRAVTLVGEQDRKMLKMAIKSATSQVKNRVVTAETVQKYRIKVENLSPKIKEVLQEEADDRKIRNAEMKVLKTENMLKHGDEIYARPARTWFQTEKEKKAAKDIGKADHKAKFGIKEASPAKKTEKRDKYAGMSRKKRRRLQMIEEDEEDVRESAKKQKLVARAAKKASRRK
ncbi:nucleolar DEAD-box protein required for synthesis of 60S ribosomal subunit [Apophysomyces sp. BC1034]|nr:nucleolar DEAD-box protein required for synthesis of 60S ribosomal subunit [Apophysomyces sp. BC1015]KAG0174604.1 nucleolar DEAD-box protein required for synthesis of 60S ribosomal subunit [Apophysomyces sp. BC1021]KAG0185847.1 nucleolar DEAD-box protein required for synthesis of 60S ribosomal subunit [Apophysomyces sp. BC1034]